MQEATKARIMGYVYESDQREKPLLHRVAPILLSLVTTPLFILDEANNLSSLKYPSSGITLRQLLGVS